MRRIIAILALGVSLAGCGGASETDHIATATSQCTTASEIKTSGTGRMHRAYQASVGECQKVIALTTSLRDQFMAVGMNEDQAQKLAEKYKNTHDAVGRLVLATERSRNAHSDISDGTGPISERFLG
jgi:adenosine deaminase